MTDEDDDDRQEMSERELERLADGPDRDPFSMSEEEVWQGTEDAYRDGLIDHVGDTPGGSPKWSLNEEGEEYTRELFEENDAALAQLAAVTVRDAPQGKAAKHLLAICGYVRDDAGVNMARRLAESDEIEAPFFEELGEEIIARFDP